MLVEGLNKISRDFAFARGQKFAKHPLADFLRHDLTIEAKSRIIPQFETFIVRGSAGQGTWAAVPWLAFFDPIETESAQHGIYVVILFNPDSQKYYLSLNQGATDCFKEFGVRGGCEVLRERALFARQRIADCLATFSTSAIELGSPADLPMGYEAGHICGLTFDANNPTNDEAFLAKLTSLLVVYRQLLFRGGIRPTAALIEDTEIDVIEEARKVSFVRRLERARNTRKQVLKHRKEKCEACGLEPEMIFLGEAKKRIALVFAT